jgi:hypothetical protein
MSNYPRLTLPFLGSLIQSCFILDSAKPFHILLENQRSCFYSFIYIYVLYIYPSVTVPGALVLISFSSFHSLVFFPSFPLFRQSFLLLSCYSYVYICQRNVICYHKIYLAYRKEKWSLLTYSSACILAVLFVKTCLPPIHVFRLLSCSSWECRQHLL